MLLGDTLCTAPQQTNVIGSVPGNRAGSEPGSYIGASSSQNSVLHSGQMAVGTMRYPMGILTT